jgi:opacity protein-like surface antigen
VLGLEADMSLTDAGEREVVRRSPFGVVVTTGATHHLESFGSARARAGFAFGNVLLFATGGLAFGEVDVSGSIIPVPAANPTYISSSSRLQTGYSVGGGVEYAFSPALSLKAEYLHYDLGEHRLELRERTGLAPGEFATMRFHTRGDIIRTGLSVRF